MKYLRYKICPICSIRLDKKNKKTITKIIDDEIKHQIECYFNKNLKIDDLICKKHFLLVKRSGQKKGIRSNKTYDDDTSVETTNDTSNTAEAELDTTERGKTTDKTNEIQSVTTNQTMQQTQEQDAANLSDSSDEMIDSQFSTINKTGYYLSIKKASWHGIHFSQFKNNITRHITS